MEPTVASNNSLSKVTSQELFNRFHPTPSLLVLQQPHKLIDDLFHEYKEGLHNIVTKNPDWNVVSLCVDVKWRASWIEYTTSHRNYKTVDVELLLNKFREYISPVVAAYHVDMVILHPQNAGRSLSETLPIMTKHFEALQAWPCLIRAIEDRVQWLSTTTRLPIRDPDPSTLAVEARGRVKLKVVKSTQTLIREQLCTALLEKEKFTHHEIAERLVPLCFDYRIDTTIATQPLYQYQQDTIIWKPDTNINQLEQWVFAELKKLIYLQITGFSTDIQELNKKIPLTEPGCRDQLAERVKTLQGVVKILESRIKSIGSRGWAFSVAQCMMPLIYNISDRAEQIGAQSFGKRLDADPFLFGLKNGQVLDLRTADVRDRTREDYCTMVSGVSYDPTAPYEEWEEFISKFMCRTQEMVDFIQEAWSYTMSASNHLELLFMVIGTPDCGKTSLFNVMKNFMGEYGYNVPKSLYLVDPHNSTGPNPTMLGTVRKRFGYTAELRANDYMDNSKLNAISTGEDTTVKAMYALKNQTFTMTMKPWFHSNYVPKMDFDEAMIKRFIYFVGRAKFTDSPDPAKPDGEFQKEARFEKRFLTEIGLSGVLNWVIIGLKRFNARGMRLPPVPAEMKLAVQQEVRNRDMVGQWLEEVCDTSNPNARLEIGTALASYNFWIGKRGKQLTSQSFGKEMAKARDGIKYLSMPVNNIRYYNGLSLRMSQLPEPSRSAISLEDQLRCARSSNMACI